MKTSKKNFVEIPTITLNAIKNMLFSSEGVDLSAIVNDLAASDDQKDLMAINVALTYKGVQIDFDKQPRYSYDWKNRYNRFECVGHSLILGIVKVQRTLVEVAENGEEKVVSTYDNIECYGFDQWEEFDSDLSAIYAKIAERTK